MIEKEFCIVIILILARIFNSNVKISMMPFVQCVCNSFTDCSPVIKASDYVTSRKLRNGFVNTEWLSNEKNPIGPIEPIPEQSFVAQKMILKTDKDQCILCNQPIPITDQERSFDQFLIFWESCIGKAKTENVENSIKQNAVIKDCAEKIRLCSELPEDGMVTRCTISKSVIEQVVNHILTSIIDLEYEKRCNSATFTLDFDALECFFRALASETKAQIAENSRRICTKIINENAFIAVSLNALTEQVSILTAAELSILTLFVKKHLQDSEKQIHLKTNLKLRAELKISADKHLDVVRMIWCYLDQILNIRDTSNDYNIDSIENPVNSDLTLKDTLTATNERDNNIAIPPEKKTTKADDLQILEPRSLFNTGHTSNSKDISDYAEHDNLLSDKCLAISSAKDAMSHNHYFDKNVNDQWMDDKQKDSASLILNIRDSQSSDQASTNQAEAQTRRRLEILISFFTAVFVISVTTVIYYSFAR